MPQATINPAAGDGTISSWAYVYTDTTWASVVSGSNLTADTTFLQAYLAIGPLSAADAYIYIPTIPFDLSAIPSGAIISAAVLRLYATAKTDTVSGATLKAVQSSQASITTLATSDWSSLRGTTVISDDAPTFTSLSTGAYNEWDLNATGLALLSPGGTLKVAMRNGLDIAATYPSPTAFGSGLYKEALATFNSGEAGSNKPELVVTYTVPGASGAPRRRHSGLYVR